VLKPIIYGVCYKKYCIHFQGHGVSHSCSKKKSVLNMKAVLLNKRCYTSTQLHGFNFQGVIHFSYCRDILTSHMILLKIKEKGITFIWNE
jgi:hypothetical protein